MTAHVLITGALFRPPESRTSKSGKQFVTATIRVKDGNPSTGSGPTSQWWKVLAFSESIQAELMRLTDGDAISVQGAFKAELYDKDGEKRLSLSIVADHVLALRQPANPCKLGEKSHHARPVAARGGQSIMMQSHFKDKPMNSPSHPDPGCVKTRESN
jgi:single-stranded DNA-binding protein